MKSPPPVGNAETELPNPIGLELWAVVGKVNVNCRAVVLLRVKLLIVAVPAARASW